MIYPSPGTDSWIGSRLFSILAVWLWLVMLGFGLGLRLVLSANRVRVRVLVGVTVNRVIVRIGRGLKIAPVMHICPSRTENNTEWSPMRQMSLSLNILFMPHLQGPRSHGVQGVSWPSTSSGVGSTYAAWPLTFCRLTCAQSIAVVIHLFIQLLLFNSSQIMIFPKDLKLKSNNSIYA